MDESHIRSFVKQSDVKSVWMKFGLLLGESWADILEHHRNSIVLTDEKLFHMIYKWKCSGNQATIEKLRELEKRAQQRCTTVGTITPELLHNDLHRFAVAECIGGRWLKLARDFNLNSATTSQIEADFPNMADAKAMEFLTCAKNTSMEELLKLLKRHFQISSFLSLQNLAVWIIVLVAIGLSMTKYLFFHNHDKMNKEISKEGCYQYLTSCKRFIQESVRDNFSPYDNNLEPIHIMAYLGLIPELNKLTACGRDISEETALGFQAIHLAAYSGNDVEVFSVLKKLFPEYNSTKVSVYKSRVRTLQFLIEEKHVPADAKTHDGQTPLHFAAYGCSVEAVRYLLRNGQVHVNILSSDMWTPLFLATKGFEFQDNLQNEYDGSVIFNKTFLPSNELLAVKRKEQCKEVIHLLLDAGADPHINDKLGETAFMNSEYLQNYLKDSS